MTTTRHIIPAAVAALALLPLAATAAPRAFRVRPFVGLESQSMSGVGPSSPAGDRLDTPVVTTPGVVVRHGPGSQPAPAVPDGGTVTMAGLQAETPIIDGYGIGLATGWGTLGEAIGGGVIVGTDVDPMILNEALASLTLSPISGHVGVSVGYSSSSTRSLTYDGLTGGFRVSLGLPIVSVFASRAAVQQGGLGYTIGAPVLVGLRGLVPLDVHGDGTFWTVTYRLADLRPTGDLHSAGSVSPGVLAGLSLSPPSNAWTVGLHYVSGLSVHAHGLPSAYGDLSGRLPVRVVDAGWPSLPDSPAGSYQTGLGLTFNYVIRPHLQVGIAAGFSPSYSFLADRKAVSARDVWGGVDLTMGIY